jgi:hypothetical protein
MKTKTLSGILAIPLIASQLFLASGCINDCSKEQTRAETPASKDFSKYYFNDKIGDSYVRFERLLSDGEYRLNIENTTEGIGKYYYLKETNGGLRVEEYKKYSYKTGSWESEVKEVFEESKESNELQIKAQAVADDKLAEILQEKLRRIN